MKKIRSLVLALLLSSSACRAGVICDPNFLNRCHTEEEWDRISAANERLLKCMRSKTDKHKSIETAISECNATYSKVVVK